MSNVYIRPGNLRAGYTMVYHEIWDVYHPYIGDKATMYYLFLLRYRNNTELQSTHGMSWRGRKGVIAKFQLGYATMPIIDGILTAAGLVDIETRPSHNGADKIYYTVHDPLTTEEFQRKEGEIRRKMTEFTLSNEKVTKGLVGKEFKQSLFGKR